MGDRSGVASVMTSLARLHEEDVELWQLLGQAAGTATEDGSAAAIVKLFDSHELIEPIVLIPECSEFLDVAGRELVGVGLPTVPSARAEAIREMADLQRSVWDEVGFASYTITVDFKCVCFGDYPLTATIVDGVIVEATDASGEPAFEFLYEFLTVESLFEQIATFASSDSIEVVYEPELGYPTLIAADPDADVVGDRLTLTIAVVESAIE